MIQIREKGNSYFYFESDLESNNWLSYMMIVQVNLQSTVEPRFVSVANKARFFVLALLSVFILLPAISQADGLFDFQMKLAKKGNVEAQFKVGEMYETGFGVKKDMAKASTWINKAASQGHETAGFKLLYWDLEKNGLNDTNKEKLDALKAKAKADDPQAQYYIGKMLAYGVGVKKNADKAITWLNKAALVGVLEAEREMVTVREDKQRQALAKRRADEKKRVKLKAQREKENLAKQEAQRKLQVRKQAAQKQAEANARAAAAAKKNQVTDEERQQANEKASQQAKEEMQAKKEAQERAQKLAVAKQREARKQALLEKRSKDEGTRKAQFESDPCSGKSARFLSTCK